ncbi:unnamed protein product [Symbiodinium sp. KB8]|nr:unnamed protein product [Symbiodinium sp. KB8]
MTKSRRRRNAGSTGGAEPLLRDHLAICPGTGQHVWWQRAFVEVTGTPATFSLKEVACHCTTEARVRQPTPPSTLRARYAKRRWESRQFPRAVRLARWDSAEAGAHWYMLGRQCFIQMWAIPSDLMGRDGMAWAPWPQAELNNQVKQDMSSIGKKSEGKTGPVDKDKAGAMKGAIQHQLKQRYRAKLQQMRGPRSA